MSDFSYYNIFETKGIEYILTIVFFLSLIPFWIFLNKKRSVSVSSGVGEMKNEYKEVPSGFSIYNNHTWAFLNKNGKALVGIDDFIGKALGKCTVGKLLTVDKLVEKGDVLAELMQDGKSLLITSPIKGKIVNVNNDVEKSPETILNDPYNKGWLYSVEPIEWGSNFGSYNIGEDAKKWFEKEKIRFKDFITTSVMDPELDSSLTILQDGGEMKNHILTDLSEKVWGDFQKKFLT